MKRFSIITVTYNSGNKLKETVTDVLKQTYDNYEIVIKDGMSTDDSLKQIPQDEKIRLFRSKDKGIYDAMNQALDMAEGEYVIFMNCGDFFYNETVLKEVDDFLSKDPGKGIYYGDVFSRISQTVDHATPEITDFVCFRHIPCHQACIFERKLFETQAFCLEYKIRADYEFFLRQYYQAGIRPAYMGIVIADYEGGGYSETKENMKRDRSEHRKITSLYMKKGKLFWYRTLMVLTLQPLRRRMAQSRRLAGMYDKAKTKIAK